MKLERLITNETIKSDESKELMYKTTAELCMLILD